MKHNGRLTYCYIDNSNLYIEGQRVSAVRKRLPGARTLSEAMDKRVIDHTAGIDYLKLYDFLVGSKEETIVAKVFGSFGEKAGSMPQFIERAGFEVLTFDRSVWNRKEKRVDTAITFHITRDMYRLNPKEVELLLVTGDSDQVPLVTELVKDGYMVTVAFWRHCAGDLRRAATNFLDLDPFFSHLVRYREPRKV